MEHKTIDCVCPNCGNKEAKEVDEGLTFSYYCDRCGYTSQSNLQLNSLVVEKFERGITHLVRNLRKEDQRHGIYWYPVVMNIKQCILMPIGLQEDWKWAIFKNNMEEIQHFEQLEFLKATEAFKQLVNQTYGK